MKENKDRQDQWYSVKEMMGNHQVFLGQHLSYQFTHTPRRILYSMSYYKFASKMIGKAQKVLDVGCGEGLGTWLLAVECGKAKGIDFDEMAIEIGKKNWHDPRISFECINFLDIKEKQVDAIVNFDVIEHIIPEHVHCFFQKIASCLTDNGITIIGTPNITSDQYANPLTRAGHVNLYSGERLLKEMKQYFRYVFIFGANDEVIHTGFLPMAQYLIAIGVAKKSTSS
jgi:2-polyprenyl-3-methyl-5-hydroxy-6-metoxy-1,4-benzoquinol methylase